MPRYIKKPIIVDAVQLTVRTPIETLEGVMMGEPGDWLITGIDGELYPCKDNIFKKTYEPYDAAAVKIMKQFAFVK